MYDNIENLNGSFQIKNSIQHSVEQLQTFFDLASDGIFELDLDGVIQSINNRLLVMLGYEEDEMLGNKIADLVAPDQLSRLLQDFQQYSKWPFEWISEWLLKRKDGLFLPVEISAKIYPDTLVRGFVRDISVRKKLEQQNQILADLGRTLGCTAEFLSRIQSVADLLVPAIADVCIVSIVEEGNFNFKAVSAKNSSMQEKIKNLGSHAGQTESSRYSAKSVLQSRQTLLVQNFPAELQKNFQEFDPELRARLLEFKVQSYVVLPMICRDEVLGALTFYSAHENRIFLQKDLPFLEIIASRCAAAIDNARLYDEARQATKAREIVLSIVSHDLRNPLSVIDLSAQMLLDETFLSHHSLESVMKRIRRSVLLMQQMISDLLDFSKAQAGTFTVDKKPVVINHLIFSSLDTVSGRAQIKDQKLIVKCKDEGRSINADERRITQVLWNLVGNAIKFTPVGGEIVLEVSVTDDCLKVSVLDSGPGLREHEFEKVFNAFWQAEKTAELGTGLGLPLFQRSCPIS